MGKDVFYNFVYFKMVWSYGALNSAFNSAWTSKSLASPKDIFALSLPCERTTLAVKAFVVIIRTCNLYWIYEAIKYCLHAEETPRARCTKWSLLPLPHAPANAFIILPFCLVLTVNSFVLEVFDSASGYFAVATSRTTLQQQVSSEGQLNWIKLIERATLRLFRWLKQTFLLWKR